MDDLRQWLGAVDQLGELRRVSGAHWDLEMGALTEVALDGPGRPALLFDDIPGYPAGFRVLTGMTNTLQRLNLTLGLGEVSGSLSWIKAWRSQARNWNPIAPRVVQDGPVLENVVTGSAVDVLQFPAPRWHELDGGRYLGTGSVTITQDPDDGSINVGTYRVAVHDRQTLGFYVAPGKHGRIHREKYWEAGKPCPVAISFGQHPLYFLAGSLDVPYRVSEYDYLGGVLGEPVEVIPGPYTGLPIPAAAELVIEGEAVPGELLPEGPFGEWTGYYAGGQRPEPCIRVKSILYRDNPIICGSPPLRPSAGNNLYRCLLRAASIWDALERAGVPDIQAVRAHEATQLFLTIVAIKQRYPGHARQAAVLASQVQPGAYMGRYVIVVDDDVDIYDDNQVLWALTTRADPQRSLEIVRRCWSGPLDPALPPGDKFYNSRALVDACRPYEWLADFPRVVGASAELKALVRQRWGGQVHMR